MAIKPLRDKVLVKESELQTTTESGIIVNSGTSNDTRSGIVIAVGPDCKEVKEGDVVYLDWRKCQVTKQDGDMVGVIDEKEIIAVVEN
jgi:chaperonin GroES